MGQIVLSIIIALYITILLSMMEEVCTLTFIKELVELSTINALYKKTLFRGGKYIDFYEGSSSVEFCNCTILKNVAYLRTGLYHRSVHITLTTNIFYF